MVKRFGPVVGVSAVVLVVVVGAGVALGTPSGEPASPAAARARAPVVVVRDDVAKASIGMGGPLCRLLELAAAADPSLQRAASRPAGDIDETAVLQQQLLDAAADLLGDDPDAAALRSLAGAFAPLATDDGGERAAGSWTDDEWAQALTERATPENLRVLTDLDTRCR